MEYGQDKGSVCTCHPVSYSNGNTLQRLLMHGSEAYTPYYNRTSEPSSALGRQPEMNNAFHSHVQKQNTTLQSVLLGEIPAEYSHLSNPHHMESRNGCSPDIPQNSSCHTSSLRIPSYHDNILSQRHVPSPHAFMSSPHQFSRHATPSPHQRMSPGHMTSPIHNMSCPTPPIHIASPAHCSSPYSTTSASPYSSSESCQDEPIDLSYKGSSSDTDDLYSSSPDCKRDSEFPMLRNLLCVGKGLQKQENFTSSQESISSESDTYSPFVTSTTRVTLAKKNMFPVSSRVSDWLVKIVQFAKTIPEFQNLSHNDKVTLILNSWTRLLILYMSESNFQFVVTPLHNNNSQQTESTSNNPAPEEPTMKSVETVQNFIKKCQNMNLDQKEYAFLRMAVLFNAGYVGLDRPDLVEQLNSLIQQLLQEHVRMTRPNDIMHYSRLLLCLPALYGINCKMIENLFCGHINGNMDLQVLLKEMLQNL